MFSRQYPNTHIVAAQVGRDLTAQELEQVATDLLDFCVSRFRSPNDEWGWIAEQDYLKKSAIKIGDPALVARVGRLIQKRQQRWADISLLASF